MNLGRQHSKLRRIGDCIRHNFMPWSMKLTHWKVIFIVQPSPLWNFLSLWPPPYPLWISNSLHGGGMDIFLEPWFPWSWFLGDRTNKFRKRQKSSSLLVNISIKNEIRHFHVVVMQWRQRNVQKSVMHMQSCHFANLNIGIAFLMFSLLSPLSLLKLHKNLSNLFRDGLADQLFDRDTRSRYFAQTRPIIAKYSTGHTYIHTYIHHLFVYAGQNKAA